MTVFKDVGTREIDAQGSEKKRKDVVVGRIHLFSDHLKSFIKHNFIFRWQAQQFKDCLLKFPSNVVLSVVDLQRTIHSKCKTRFNPCIGGQPR